MRWSVNWVGGLQGAPDPNPNTAARNSKIAVGLTVLEPGHKVPATPSAVTRLWLVAEGTAITNLGDGNTELGYLDGLHVPAGEVAAFRNNGPGPLRLLRIDCQR
jgi:mannose-6-phosphate isomerase-like protein (cupin superfamily)